MRTTYLPISSKIAAILLCIVPVTLFATSKLTIIIAVDGLSEQNIATLRPYLSTGGLRILSEEAFQSAVSYPHAVYGGRETLATLLTGTTPNHHGIESNYFFDRTDRAIYPVLQDMQVSGIGTPEQVSPRSIQTNTLSDDWRLRYGTNAKIYAIGLESTATILMAGHAANACCWLNADPMQWITTSFYTEGLPAVADEMNINERLTDKGEQLWTPRMDIALYNHPTIQEKKRPFSYTSKQVILHSPAANDLVVELALQLQQSKQLGDDDVPDLLLLHLNALSPKSKTDAIESAEQEDLYMHLNKALGFLMEQLNSRIGKSQYQLALIGLPKLGYSEQDLQTAGLAVNHFNVDRAAALTGTYLMAIYGHERWVDGGYGSYIYLNRTLIEQKQLSLETIQRQVANFLMDFEGVEVAYPIHEALMSPYAPSIYRKHAGDIYFRLQDNWLLDYAEEQPLDHVVQNNPTSPILLWSGSLRTFPAAPVSATEIKQLILK